ncbi:hypothetical protein E2C01_029332 [Portunus trituberculatus]|uniref:Uncharacterized protein n=1 Tax=Portunus trituberculatus TaxID=210409 RepID=A0A5B7ERP7_PORTR|nr:hypothetical protein [Portunus trituberculatus]
MIQDMEATLDACKTGRGGGGGRRCQDHVLLRSDSHLETKAAGVGLRFVSYPVIPTWPAGAAGCPASQDGSQLINTVPASYWPRVPEEWGGGNPHHRDAAWVSASWCRHAGLRTCLKRRQDARDVL